MLDATAIATIVLAAITLVLAIATFWIVIEMRNDRKRDRLTKEMETLIQPLYEIVVISKIPFVWWRESRNTDEKEKYREIKSNSMLNKYLGTTTDNLSKALEKRHPEIQKALDEHNTKHCWQFWK
jgi:hypothetical protein